MGPLSTEFQTVAPWSSRILRLLRKKKKKKKRKLESPNMREVGKLNIFNYSKYKNRELQNEKGKMLS